MKSNEFKIKCLKPYNRIILGLLKNPEKAQDYLDKNKNNKIVKLNQGYYGFVESNAKSNETDQ